jgi:serine/threonine protein phosphatase PrpC
VRHFRLAPGARARVLLASDGIWDVIEGSQLRAVVKKYATASAHTCATAVARAAHMVAVNRVLRARHSGGFASDDERARAEAEAKLRCDDIGVIIVDIEPGLPGALPGRFPAAMAHPLDASPVARLAPAPTTTPGMASLEV